MKNIVNKVFSYMEECRMLLPGERVAAGISGGADSVCLLFVLLEWRKRHGLEFAAVHVNHGIRAEAGEDAAFVEELCRRYEIPFYLREVDVRGFAEQRKCSEEEAGRILRYRAFEEAAEEFRAEKIAVAHNLNDRGETMLFNLFRGSGIRGLAGILPVRGRIIRPLLCLERGEIEAYLAELGQDYCRDVTNDGDHYTRNRIRHHVLPYVEREVAAGCVPHMGKTAELLAETEDYLARQTAEALKDCTEEIFSQGLSGYQVGALADGREASSAWADAQGFPGETAVSKVSGYQVDIRAFLDCHPALQKRMLYDLLRALSPGALPMSSPSVLSGALSMSSPMSLHGSLPMARDISSVHVEDVRTLFTQEGNRQICLPFGIRARREYGKVILERGHGLQPGSGKCERSGGLSSPEGSEHFRAEYSVLDMENLPRRDEKTLIFPQNQYTKWFDYDKIKEWPTLRTRETGDYLTIADGRGGMHHKSLKDYMVTEKIPKSRRDSLPVLAEDSHVLWLVGYRISEYYKISENTKRVLQVQLITESETEDKNGRKG